MSQVQPAEEAVVMTRGDRLIQMGIRRGYSKMATEDERRIKEAVGLTIFLKAAPAVEELFRSNSNGEEHPVEMFGREWIELPNEAPLRVYGFNKILQSGREFTFNHPGNQLIMQDAGLINLSFLRLVGISQGAGVRFGVKDVLDKDEVIVIKNQIISGMTRFCNAYLCPLDMTLSISTT